jgi:hypothetical protein
MSRENVEPDDPCGFVAMTLDGHIASLGQEEEEMASYVIRGLSMIVAAGVFALSPAPPAEASKTVGDCTITALKPTDVELAFNGKPQVAPRASFRCATPRRLQYEIYLYGDDAFFDDRLNSNADGVSYWRVVGTTELLVGKVNTAVGWSCNEDPEGNDELYSRVRARLNLPGGLNPAGVYTAWSAWDRGPTGVYVC